MKSWVFGLIVVCFGVFAGCSDFQDPSKNLCLENVVGGGRSLAPGMSKDEVMEKWGHADDVRSTGDTRWGLPKETWTYYAFIPKFPVNYRYMSKGRRLFFEGNNLVSWEEIAEESTLDEKDESEKPVEKGEPLTPKL